MSQASEANKALDQLAKAIATGQVKIVSVRANVCGHCKEGTLQYDGTPNWMNRYVCDKCGKEVSR